MGYQFLSMPETQHVPLVNRSGKKVRPQSAVTESLQITALSQSSTTQDYALISSRKLKNIFAPLSFPKPSRPSLNSKSGPTTPIPIIPSPPKKHSLEVLAGERARKEMAEYRFLGLLYEGAATRVFLVKNQEIFIVGEGDALKGDIRVVKVQPTTVQLQYADTDIITIISISDSQTL